MDTTTAGLMQPTPGRKVTRRLEEPRLSLPPKRPPDCNAEALTEAHNAAVKAYGSDCGGWHAYDYDRSETVGVFSDGPFPKDSVVTPLAWGRIDTKLAQRVLEYDGR